MIFHSVPPRSLNKHFTVYGKVLMLCQTFEERCMYHYKMLSIFLGLKNERISVEDLVAGKVYWSSKDRKPTSKKTSLGVFTKNRKKLFVDSNTLRL